MIVVKAWKQVHQRTIGCTGLLAAIMRLERFATQPLMALNQQIQQTITEWMLKNKSTQFQQNLWLYGV